MICKQMFYDRCPAMCGGAFFRLFLSIKLLLTVDAYNFNVKIGAFIEHIFMVLYEVSCGGSRMTAL